MSDKTTEADGALARHEAISAALHACCCPSATPCARCVVGNQAIRLYSDPEAREGSIMMRQLDALGAFRIPVCGVLGHGPGPTAPERGSPINDLLEAAEAWAGLTPDTQSTIAQVIAVGYGDADAVQIAVRLLNAAEAVEVAPPTDAEVAAGVRHETINEAMRACTCESPLCPACDTGFVALGLYLGCTKPAASTEVKEAQFRALRMLERAAQARDAMDGR